MFFFSNCCFYYQGLFLGQCARGDIRWERKEEEKHVHCTALIDLQKTIRVRCWRAGSIAQKWASPQHMCCGTKIFVRLRIPIISMLWFVTLVSQEYLIFFFLLTKRSFILIIRLIASTSIFLYCYENLPIN